MVTYRHYILRVKQSRKKYFGCNFLSKDTALWDIQMLQFTYFPFNSHSITALRSYYCVSLELLSSQDSATKFLSEIYAKCPVNRSKYNDYITYCCKLCCCSFFSHYNNNSYWTAWLQYGHTHPALTMKTEVRSHSPSTHDEDSSTITLTQHSASPSLSPSDIFHVIRRPCFLW